MPIQISDNDTKLSFAYAVNRTQGFFEIKEEDSKFKTAGEKLIEEYENYCDDLCDRNEKLVELNKGS